MAEYGDLSYALAGYGKKANRFDERRKYGYDLQKQGSDMSPILSPWQGAARLAQALAGGADLALADRDEAAADKKRSDALAQAMAEPDPQKRIGLIAAYDPDTGARAAGQLAVDQAKLQEQRKGLREAAGSFGSSFSPIGAQDVPGALPQMPSSGPATAIASLESAGAPNGGYSAVGPVATPQGNRAYGKFQVLDSNIGPWTQEILGKPMSPQEFLASPEAQNKVFEGKFGQYVTQYGSPQAASRAWFAGPNGMNNPNAKDVNGTTVSGYETKFTNAGGAGPQAAAPPSGQAPAPQGAPPMPAPAMTGQPPAPSPQAASGPTLVAPSVPDVARPQPSPQQIQQFQQRLNSGEFGTNPAEAVPRARAALDAEIDRQWGVDRDKAKMGYEQQSNDYRANRDQGLKQPQETVQNESKLREQFDQLQTTKDYRKANTVFRNAIEAAKSNSAAADLNLVYSFATMMDPGSVVREGEMGMVKATQNASDQVKAMVAAVSGGQRISPEARQNLLDQMAVRHEAYKSLHDQQADFFGGVAERNGMKRENIVAPVPGAEWTRRTDNQTGLGGRGGPRAGGGQTIRIDLNGRPQ